MQFTRHGEVFHTRVQFRTLHVPKRAGSVVVSATRLFLFDENKFCDGRSDIADCNKARH